MPGGVIDEFMIKIGMEGDPSGLVDAYKKIFQLQDEYEEKERKRQAEEDAKNEKENKKEEKKRKRQEKFNKIVTAGSNAVKQGVSMARNWAVALLAVDGAAMAVIGKLSQMAVEYDNTAGSINMAASEMKAWEDTLKSAGATAPDVTSSLQSLYEKSYKTMMGEGDAGFQSAMAAFGVQTTTETGEMRNTGDIFADVIEGFRDAVESGMDKNLAIGYLEQAGVSRNLAQPLLRTDESGQYLATEEDFQKYLNKAAPLDELADASLGLTESLTELSATFRNKFAVVLTDLMDSGVLEKMLDELTALVDGIDAEEVADAIQMLLEAAKAFAAWVWDKIGGFVEWTEGRRETKSMLEEDPMALQKWSDRIFVLSDAVEKAFREQEGGAALRAWRKTARAGESEGGFDITETEWLSKANELGLNVNQIFQQANLPPVNNDIKVFIDGKLVSFTKEEYLNYDASSVDSGRRQ